MQLQKYRGKGTAGSTAGSIRIYHFALILSMVDQLRFRKTGAEKKRTFSFHSMLVFKEHGRKLNKEQQVHNCFESYKQKFMCLFAARTEIGLRL